MVGIEDKGVFVSRLFRIASPVITGVIIHILYPTTLAEVSVETL
jgi:hypothetical protein